MYRANTVHMHACTASRGTTICCFGLRLTLGLGDRVRIGVRVRIRARARARVTFGLRCDGAQLGTHECEVGLAQIVAGYPPFGLAQAAAAIGVLGRLQTVLGRLRAVLGRLRAEWAAACIRASLPSRQGESPSAALTLASICSSHFGETPGSRLRSR